MFIKLKTVLVVKPIGIGVVGYYFRDGGAGHWVGNAGAGLGLSGSVTPHALARVLAGRHPALGYFLPTVRPARRRAGWDLVFAAPKSVSLLAAMAPGGHESIVAAHRVAVADAFAYLEKELLAVRRADAPGGRAPCTGTVAAVFQHDRNAATEPHLHSHLLLANLGRAEDGTWSAISHFWWPQRQSLSALYQLGLRHHLATRGWDLEWRLRPDGLGDVADVPRAAVRATSSRSYRMPSTGRVAPRETVTPQPWRAKVQAAGFGPSDAASAATVEPAIRADPRTLADAVTVRLAARSSTFREGDVVVALAACSPRGLAAGEARTWASRFCAEAIPVLGASGATRWTTDLARQADERLVATVNPTGAVEIVRAAPDAHLLAPAALVDASRRGWEAAGLRVAVSARDALSAARWEALTGLPPYRSGTRVDVLIVDQADRRATPELLALTGRSPKLVLVEGGTLPATRWKPSRALGQLEDILGTIDPGPAPDWSLAPGTHGGSSGLGAARHLLSRWLDAQSAGSTPVLVGLGLAEVQGLNAAARTMLTRNGAIEGPSIVARGRPFQAGDAVIALRRLGSDAPFAGRGTVAGVDPDRRRAAVAWNGTLTWLTPTDLAHVGHGYAVTPAVAARVGGPLMVLGRAEDLGRDRARVVVAARAAPSIERDGLGLG
jgi:conjugative relaxase-like TrwC/TraI family protein